MSNSKWQLHYPELGGVDKKRRFYGEGEEYVHPAGVRYIHRNGRWVIKEDPSIEPISDETSSESI